jgi:hypothetical protein
MDVSSGRPGDTAVQPPSVTVRVTLAAAGRRVGLVLPADLPVAELVPGLARVLGTLDGRTAYGGFRLTTSDGRRLRAEAGLTDQGVRHGQVLTLVAAVDDPEPSRYDDPAEAMADTVGAATSPGPAAETLAAGVVVATSSAVGLLAALLARPGIALVVLLGVTAAVQVTAATVLSRGRGRGLPSVLLAWLGCAQAAGAGSLLAAADDVRLAGAGAALVLSGAAASAGLAVGRLLLLPPLVVGTVLLAAVAATSALPLRVGWVVTVLLATVTVAADRLPALALAASGGHASAGGRHVDEPVDPGRVRAWARAADRLVVAGTASVVGLLVVAAPYAVSIGPSGVVASVLCDLVVLLRARGQRDPARAIGGAGALLGLLATAGCVLWLQPAWRGAEAAALSVAGFGGLGHLLGARPDPLLVERLCEVARSVALVALPSAVLVASGVLAVPSR